MQHYNDSEFNVFDDRTVGALIVMSSGSTVSFFVDVLADPCPSVVWSFNGTVLGSSNDTITYNNPCREGASKSLIWTYTLNVVLTSDTSGQYLASFTNVAGTTFLPMAYFTIPGMLTCMKHRLLKIIIIIMLFCL